MSSSVTYTAVLDMRRETVSYVSGLLHAERRRRGTRRGRRALGCFAQTVLILRWFLDGGNVQVLSAPDRWPLWTSGARPGREHDVTCARHHGIINALTAVRDHLIGLADLGYEGEAAVLRVPIKKRKGVKLTTDQKTYNKLIRSVRGIGERANALLIMRFKALRRVSLDPSRIGSITAAALVLLRHDQERTT